MLKKQKFSFNVLKNDLRTSLRSWSNQRMRELEIKETKQKHHLMLIACQNLCAGFRYQLNVMITVGSLRTYVKSIEVQEVSSETSENKTADTTLEAVC